MNMLRQFFVFLFLFLLTSFRPIFGQGAHDSGRSSIGLTVATTTITDGTSGRLFYNNAGVFDEASILHWNGSQLGVGTAMPAAPLDVVGNINTSGDIRLTSGNDIGQAANSNIQFGSNVINFRDGGATNLAYNIATATLSTPSVDLTIDPDEGDVGTLTIGDGTDLDILQLANDSFLLLDTNAGITAGTTQTQAGATALTAQVNQISTCANANDGAALPPAAAGLIVRIINNGAQVMQVWPDNGQEDTIDGGAADAVDANTLAVGDTRTYVAYNTNAWETLN